MSELLPLDSLTTSPNSAALPQVNHFYLNDPDDDVVINTKARLEYRWGLKLRELDYANPLNSVELRADMIELFRRMGWILVPTIDTLQEMIAMQVTDFVHDVPNRKLYTDVFPPKEYEYIFIPVLLLKEKPPIYIKHPDSALHVRHDFPYDSIPHFKSSCHPFYAVYSARDAICVHYNYLPVAFAPLLDALDNVWAKQPPLPYRFGRKWRQLAPRHQLKLVPQRILDAVSDSDSDAASSPESSELGEPAEPFDVSVWREDCWRQTSQ